MKFEINSEDVVKVTKLCKKVISSKSGLPVLSQIKVEVLPGKIFFSCTDLEMCLITTIECKTEGEGTFLLPFKAIEKVKSNGKVIVRYENSIEIQNSTGSVSIIPNDSEEFPMISKDEAQYMLGEDFLEKTAGCLPAVSSDESRSILNSVCIQKDAVLSTDGKRLHVFKTANPELFPGFNDSGIIVPAKTIKTLQAIAKLEKVKVLKIGGSTKTVPNSEEDSQSGISEPEDPQICEPLSVTFEIGNTILSSKVIDGIYPEWKNVIPQEVKSVVIIERKPLIAVLTESLNYTDPKYPAVILYCNGNNEKKLDIYTDGDSQQSKYYANLPYVIEGADEVFGLSINPEYMLDALKLINSDKVKLKFVDSIQPVVLEGDNASEGLFVIMPIRRDDSIVPYSEFCEQEKQKVVATPINETVQDETTPESTNIADPLPEPVPVSVPVEEKQGEDSEIQVEITV